MFQSFVVSYHQLKSFCGRAHILTAGPDFILCSGCFSSKVFYLEALPQLNKEAISAWTHQPSNRDDSTPDWGWLSPRQEVSRKSETWVGSVQGQRQHTCSHWQITTQFGLKQELGAFYCDTALLQTNASFLWVKWKQDTGNMADCWQTVWFKLLYHT